MGVDDRSQLGTFVDCLLDMWQDSAMTLSVSLTTNRAGYTLWGVRRIHDDSFFRLLICNEVGIIVARPFPWKSMSATHYRDTLVSPR